MVHLLLCEDEKSVYDLVLSAIEIIEQSVEDEEISITWAMNVEDGHMLIEKGGWDLIMCDIFFGDEPDVESGNPELWEGMELVSHANEKRGGKGNRPHVIVVSQYASDQYLCKMAKDKGADDVLAKMQGRRLAEHIRRLMGLESRSGQGGSLSLFTLFAQISERIAQVLQEGDGEGYVGLPEPG